MKIIDDEDLVHKFVLMHGVTYYIVSYGNTIQSYKVITFWKTSKPTMSKLSQMYGDVLSSYELVEHISREHCRIGIELIFEEF
jgi:hypothetical protein